MSYLDVCLVDDPGFLYLMNEASGQPQDSSGNGNHTTTTVGTPIYGVEGPLEGMTAINFTGTQAFTAPNHASMNFNDILSLELWVKRNAVGVAQTVMLSKDIGGYGVGHENSNVMALFAAGDHAVVYSTGTIADTTTWHHIVITHNDDDNHWYIDGVEGTDALLDPAPLLNSTAVLNIAQNPSAGQKINMRLAGIAGYPTVLSGARVLAHYNAAFAAEATFGGHIRRGMAMVA